jgi:peptidoglycan/LPS O-acetylase OafA/YrhL
LKFRNDISGLRAFAVIPVLLFHAGVPLFHGGFLGVDVFFVISGFLITGIIIDGVRDGSFTYRDFYNKRIRRIFPALLFVVIVCCVLSLFFMVPYDLKSFGQSVFATLMSVNNILLYMTSGYWSLASEFKPLYHTWSLSVEEQFYILMPLLVIVCFNVFNSSKRALSIAFISIVLLSFFYSLSIDDREFNFLILFSRAWELLFGSIGAVLIRRFDIKDNSKVSGAVAFLGFILIIFSYFKPYMFSSNQAIVNIVPVLGAFLVLVFSNSNYGVGRFLALRPFVFVGLISYSTYLWHQPLLSYLRLASDSPPELYVQVIFSFLSLPLAYVTWRFVENPFRNSVILPNVKFYSLFCTSFSAVLLFGLALHFTYGFESASPNFSYGGNPQAFVDSAFQYSRPKFSDDGKVKVLIVGNSFARDFINVIHEIDSAKHVDVVYREWNGSEITDSITDLLNHADYVFVGLNWGHPGRTESVQFVCDLYNRLHEMSTGNVFVVGTKNFGWNNNFVKTMKHETAIHARVLPLEQVSVFNDEATKRLKTNYINLMQYFVDSQGMVPVFYQGRFITYDGNHLTKNGVKYVANYLSNDSRLADMFNRQLGTTK